MSPILNVVNSDKGKVRILTKKEKHVVSVCKIVVNDNLKTVKLNEIGQIRNLIKLAGPDPILNHIIGWDERKDLIGQIILRI